MPAVLVLGARNLGGAIAREFAAAGWDVAVLARSADVRDALEADGIATVDGDAADVASLTTAVGAARDALGGLDAIVNAVSASRAPDDGSPFGGGPLREAGPAAFEGWTAAVARQAFVFLSVGTRELVTGTLVQVTGGSARRANPGRGLWSAGSAAVRALTHAAAQEHRAEGLHVALLVVDATIASPKTQGFTQGTDPAALADQQEVARAAVYLATQAPSALTHELVVTPAGDRWLP